MMNLFHKKKNYKMDMNQADQTLQNVFAACNKTPCTLPFDQLMLRRRMSRLPYIHAITLASCALILTLLSPVAFLPPVLPLQTVSEVQSSFVLESSHLINGELYLTLSDKHIDLKRTYMETASGSRMSALGISSDGELQLPYPDPPEETNIYIYNTNGQILHLLLTPEK